VLLLVVACGRVGFDPSLGDAATSNDAVVAACAQWGAFAPPQRGAFAPPQRIVKLSSGSTDWAPSVSSDELRMVFSSDRAGTRCAR